MGQLTEERESTAAAGEAPGDALFTPRRVLKLGIWLGAIASLHAIGRAYIVPYHLGWLANPNADTELQCGVANMALFAVLAALLAAAASRVPASARPAAARLAAGLLAVVLVADAARAYAAISISSAFMLGAGVAAQGLWLAGRWPRVVGRLAARSFYPLVGAAVLLSLAPGAVRYAAEVRGERRVPPARAGAPNVVLIVLDTVRAKSLALYGNSGHREPALARLASEGVLFERATAPSTWTVPSHASLFTGLYPNEHGMALYHPLAPALPTLAEVLLRHGYLTAAFCANQEYCSRQTGLSRGFVHYDDGSSLSADSYVTYSRFLKMIAGGRRAYRLFGYPELGRKSAELVNARVGAWLDRHSSRPFFLFINYLDAHTQYRLPPGRRQGARGAAARKVPKVIGEFWEKRTPEEQQISREAYEECITYLDEQVGALLDRLRRDGLLENTLVVVTSDHGEAFGEHGMILHTRAPYRCESQVPLIVRFPGRAPAGGRARQAASLTDLPATILDLLGIDDGTLPGQSLSAYWRDPSAPARPVACVVDCPPLRSPACPPYGKYLVSAVWEGGLQYLKSVRTGKEEVYDTLNDPEERHNLAGLPAYRERVARLRKLWAEMTTRPRGLPEAASSRR